MPKIVHKEGEIIMLNIAVCDDVPEICKQISIYIEEYCKENDEKFSLHLAYNAQNLYKILDKEKIDLLFLDIELPDINGIEIGNYIRKTMQDDEMQIVYISGKQDYFRELFDIRPMNFLDKPFTKEDIYEQIKEAARLGKKTSPAFSYKVGQDTFFQKIKDIIYFEIVGKKTKMVTTSSETHFYADMEEIEKQLAQFYFVPVHKSFLVNMDKIEKYGSKEVVMKDGKKIPISRSKKDNFFNRLLKFEKDKLFTKF